MYLETMPNNNIIRLNKDNKNINKSDIETYIDNKQLNNNINKEEKEKIIESDNKSIISKTNNN